MLSLIFDGTIIIIVILQISKMGPAISCCKQDDKGHLEDVQKRPKDRRLSHDLRGDNGKIRAHIPHSPLET